MAQTKLCVYLAVLGYLEGRSLSRRDHLELVNCYLYLTRGEILVDSALSAHTDNALCQKHELCSDAESLCEDLAVGSVVKCELKDTASVAKVDKYKCAKVSLFLSPTHNANSFSYVLCAELTAIVSALVVSCQKFCHFY